jgi:orotate phosphoribosyltransferase
VDAHKQELVDLMIECDVLRFGEFTTKSGRRTPYFVDTGRFRTGSQLARLARVYARAIDARVGDGFDVLFGPAYKGIPLCAAVSVALYERHGRDVGYCYNRKEAKDHGEGGSLVGHSPRDGDRVLLVEDVITAGTSVRETIPILRAAADVRLVGLVVSVDRMERGPGGQSALAEVRDEFGLDAFAVVTIDEILAYLRGRSIGGRVVLDEALHTRCLAYRAEYGAA